MKNLELPEKPRGRPPKEWYKQLKEFSRQLQEIQKRMDHKVSSRGWCYVLEGMGLISKGQFDYVQGLINKARKKDDKKYLPIDFVLQDKDREFKPKEAVDRFDVGPEEYLVNRIEDLLTSHEAYDIGFWQYQDVYIQTVVEKIDLFKAWKSISYKYHIPIANTSGWYSILMRAKMIERFKKAEEYGKQPILLIFTDFDPYGRDMIAKKMRENINNLSESTHWTADNLIIDRFGLTKEQVEKYDLTWIENLETGSGKDLASPSHPDHNKEFVQRWLDEIGERKVEANALIKEPEVMEEIYEKAIKSHLSEDPLEEYEEEVQERKERIKELIEEKGMKELLERVHKELS